MNFGPPSMEIAERPAHPDAPKGSYRSVPRRHVRLKGTHWLVASPWLWRIDLADGSRVRSTSPAKAQNFACARLGGEKLREIEIDPATGRTTFRFDLGGLLTVAATGPMDSEYDELWSLHSPAHRFVSVHADGTYQTGSTRAADPPKRALTLTGKEKRFVSVRRRR